MRASGKKRVVAIRFSSSSEAAEFLEHALPRIRGAAVEQSGAHVKVALPPSEAAEEDYRRLMALLRQWRLSRGAPRRGAYRHSVSLLLSSAKLEVAVPPAAIADALSLMGYEARVEGGYLVTSASFEKAVEVSERFSRLYAEALRVPAAPLPKRLAAVWATVRGCGVEGAFGELERAGLVKRDASGRYVLAASYEEALRRLRQLAGR